MVLWVGLAISAAAVWLLRDVEGPWTACALGTGIIQFWSTRTMRKFAIDAVVRRSGRLSGVVTERDVNEVPNWITWINMIAVIAAVGLLIAGFIF